MSFGIFNRIKEYTTITGYGNITLTGVAPRCVPFSTMNIGSTFFYAVDHLTADEWELGFGTLVDATTIQRISVEDGSSGQGNLVNFSSGTKEVYITISATHLVYTSNPVRIDLLPKEALLTGALDEPSLNIMSPTAGNINWAELRYTKGTNKSAKWFITPSRTNNFSRYGGNSLTVDIYWVSPTSGDCIFELQFAGNSDGSSNIDLPFTSFTHVITAVGNSNEINSVQYTFVPEPGEWGSFLAVKLTRLSDNVLDTINDYASIISVALTEDL
jgi:hypothetical protein